MHSKNYKRTNKNKGTKEKMNKSGIITTHGFTLNLFDDFFHNIDLCKQKCKKGLERSGKLLLEHNCFI